MVELDRQNLAKVFMVVRVHPMPLGRSPKDKLTFKIAPFLKIRKIFLDLPPIGIVAEWLGTALQKLVQRFESARCLKDPALKLGLFVH